MQNDVNKQIDKFNVVADNAVLRLTALWAFSESALGGFLHLFKVPFTGAIINSVSAILIIMIASFSLKRKTIFKATILVIAVKAAAAPYTPVNAFVSVLFQGFLGELLFSSKKFFSVKAIVFSCVTLFQSAVQRIVVLTIMVGMSFWKSIDIFGNVLAKKVGLEKTTVFFSLIIVCGYILLYLFIGFVVGIVGSKIPEKVKNRIKNNKFKKIKSSNKIPDLKQEKNKIHNRYKIRILPLLLLLALVGSYFIPEITFFGKDILIMLFRYTIIMVLWTFWASKFLLEKGKKIINKKSYIYKKDIDFLLKLLPEIKKITYFCWQETKSVKGVKRVFSFLELLISYIISVEEI